VAAVAVGPLPTSKTFPQNSLAHRFACVRVCLAVALFYNFSFFGQNYCAVFIILKCKTAYIAEGNFAEFDEELFVLLIVL